MEEKRIALWQRETINWKSEDYIEPNSDYRKKRAFDKYYIWEAVFYLAEQMGICKSDLEYLVVENKNVSFADLLFAMYMIKLFGREYAERYLSNEKTVTFETIATLIRDGVGYLIDQKTNEVITRDTADPNVAKEVERIFKEIAQSNTQMQERFDAYSEQLKKALEAYAEKIRQETKTEKSDPKAEDEMTKFQKMEVDYQVLKYQLAHKDEMTRLQVQLSEKDAKLEQAEARIKELEKRCEELAKKDEQRTAEYQNVLRGYQVAIEANTQQLSQRSEKKRRFLSLRAKKNTND